MKLFCILFFLFFLNVEAQRRAQTRQEITNAEPPVRSRGRSRFTNPESDYSIPPEIPSRRIPSRRRQELPTSAPIEKPNYPSPASSTPTYAVQELIDEGEALPKSRDLPEPKLVPQILENEDQSVETGNSAENVEEAAIPTVRINTEINSSSREESKEDVQAKLVPITRNNVRNKAAERRADVRNGNSRTGDRGSRNGNSRSSYENSIPIQKTIPSRSRNDNIAARRPSTIEDSGTFNKQDQPIEIPNTIPIPDSSKDENEIRKEIVRNSMPKLPSPIGLTSILGEPPLPKKTVKKTIKTRLNTNTRSEEVAQPRGRSNQRVVENIEPSPRFSSRNVEDFSAPSRGRSFTSPSDDAQSSRSRSSITPRTNEVITTGRSRTRATRKPTEPAQTATVPSRRGGRRRNDPPATSSPLPRRVFPVSEELPSSRSRTGRKIEADIPRSDTPQSSRARGRSRNAQASDQVSSGSSRRQTTRTRDEDQGIKPRQRFNPRSPLNIDESKLEVLPLFEGETKIVSESGRKTNQLAELISTPTESENKVLSPPKKTTPSISISSDMSMSSKVSTLRVSSRRKTSRKPEIKETVISQVTEVTSKRTITRKPIGRPGGGNRQKEKKILETKLNGLTSSEEDISASDNYPEPFKALIQSKKHEKESRPSNVPEDDSKTKKIVSVVSSTSPRSVLVSPSVPSRTTTYSSKYVEDLDNEIQPKPSTSTSTFRPTKKRLSPSFKNLESRNKKTSTTPLGRTVIKSTSAPPKEPKEHKFHSKFSSVSKSKPGSTAKPFVGSPKSLNFTRKGKDGEKYTTNRAKSTLDTTNNRGQSTVAPIFKSSKYSSRYRSNGSPRTVTRTTAPPAYIPTIPSVRSYSSTVRPKEDAELGLEYISFDIQNRGIYSANLIKGEYQGSEDANSLDTKQEKSIRTTEKPVSIIEQIINSITGINITTEPTHMNFVPSSTPEPTKSSAILSLAPKKLEKTSRANDKTQQKIKSNKRDAATSEKPTTIIQRILDSLSAIQAGTTTETTTVLTTDNPKQVGTNFNTLSVRTTTPSNLDLETASFSSTPSLSTTINPLVVLDTISDEQVLQKRTIGKLLDILNSLTTQHPDSTKLPETTKLVYVTPKLSNYFYATPGTLESLTTEKIVTSTSSSSEPSTLSVSVSDNQEMNATTEVPPTTTTVSASTTTSDSPLSISLDLSTAPYIENNVLYSTTPRIHPIVMNIQSFLAAYTSTSAPTTQKSVTVEPPTATSLFTPAKTTISTTTISETPTTTSTTTSTVSSTPISSSEGDTVNTISSSEVPPENSSKESSTIPENIFTTPILGSTDTPEGTTTSTSSSTENIFPLFSTVPTFTNFEVSPGSVSIFSANDLLSNAVTPDDFFTSTISIPGKVSDSSLTPGKTTYPTTEAKTINDGQNSIFPSVKTTTIPSTSATYTTQARITSTPTETVKTTTTSVEPTTLSAKDNFSTSVVTTEMFVNTSNPTPSTTASSITNSTSLGSGRIGKLIKNFGDEVSNSIDTSSMGPDYFIFAVLPNNTILRKRPPVYPKETPFVIVGVYPNNTVIRKYPNGTLIPMDPVIRVNTTPLNIVNSSNTTTNEPENMTTTTRSTTKEPTTTTESYTREAPTSFNTVIPDNIPSSTTLVPSTTLPSISELLNGKTVKAFNSLVNNALPPQDSTTKLTTEVISLEQLLSQLKSVKPPEPLEDNNINDVGNKVDENAIISSTTTKLPGNTVTVAPFSFSTTTGYPSFFSTLITTLQSIGTTRLPVAPTTQTPFRYSSTYRAPLSTTVITTTDAPTTTKAKPTTTTTSRVITTTVPPTTTLPPTTSTIPPTTTTTNTPNSIMNDVIDSSTPPPFTSKPAVSPRTAKGLSTTVFPYFNPSDFPLLSFLSTERPRRTNEESTTQRKETTQKTTATTSKTTPTTSKISTTSKTSTISKTTATVGKVETTTESLEELLKKPIDSIKPKKKLTEQQKKDLETIRRLEQEQAAILKQLSLLTNLNLNNFGNGGSAGNLANRIISLAKERDSRRIKTETKKPTTTTIRTTTTTTESTTTLKSKSEDEAEKERMRQIESLIKLLNMNGVTPSPKKGATYGTSNDAILAALLKERGIGPSTPKQLAEQLEQSGFFTTSEVTPKPTRKPTPRTTRKPKVTTQPTRGPLLNWLLDAFAPAPTKAPSRKPKTTTKKPKPQVVDEDIMTNEPTHITPVVSPAPKTKKENSISQDDIQKLIKQLEAIQKDPSAAKNLDLASFKSLQSLNKDNVQVFMPGSSGVSERETTRAYTRAISSRNSVTTTETSLDETTTKKRKSGARAVRTSTSSPTPVSNYLQDDDEVVTATTKGRVTLPPVRLRPVSGVSDDAGSMVRGRLLTAAVNVTRAISGFLGSAFQDAVRNLARSLSSGSLANIAGGSSIPTNSDVASLDEEYTS